MKPKWNLWYDINGCGETTLALTPLKDKKHAEKKKKEIVQALKLMKLAEQRFENARNVYNGEHYSQDHKQFAMQVATTLQSVLDEAKK